MIEERWDLLAGLHLLQTQQREAIVLMGFALSPLSQNPNCLSLRLPEA